MEYFAVQLRIAEIPEYFLQKLEIGLMLFIDIYHSKGQIVFITAYCLQPRPVVKLLCGKDEFQPVAENFNEKCFLVFKGVLKREFFFLWNVCIVKEL